MDLAPISHLIDLHGRTAVVTGGAMGIGQAIVARLCEAGAHVVIADADREAAEATAKDLRTRGLAATAVQTFVEDEASVAELVEITAGVHGSIDVLVNNAGIFPATPVLEMDTAEFDRVIAVNLRGVFLTCKYVAAQQVRLGLGGRIVNVTSVDALHPSMVGLAHYDASKHGVWGFTKNLARELAPHGIWVNAVAPGGILTPGSMHMQIPDAALATGAADAVGRIPMGRMGDPDEIARAVLFLSSDLASYMTGSHLVVDGGMLLA
ncbi:MAG TPA: SDR family NAD(P)-dependent oxidoreductase [Marmoricola sp.]|nr:SDR family NAD(P)-dependent oxidoreductase [Marmoricola sp.]